MDDDTNIYVYLAQVFLAQLGENNFSHFFQPTVKLGELAATRAATYLWLFGCGVLKRLARDNLVNRLARYLP